MNWQEKFQTVLPGKIEDGESWASAESTRVVNPQTSLQLPPGYDASGPMESFTNVAGSDSPSDTRHDVYGKVRKGFVKQQMNGTDDQYTGEHADQFYSDAGGFVERSNYLDRL